MLLALGLVDAAAGPGQGKQIEFAEQGWIQGIPPTLTVGQNVAQEPGDPLLAQPLAQGIDGHDPANPLRADGGRGTVQHFDQGIAEGRAIGGLLHQTADRHTGPHGVLVLLEPERTGGGEASTRQEARHPQASGAVVQLELEDRQVGVARADEGMAAAHPRHDCGGVAGHQIDDAHEAGVVEVVAGVVLHQIPHHQKAEAGQLTRQLRAHPRDLQEGGIGLQATDRRAGVWAPLQPQPRRGDGQGGAIATAQLVQALAQLAHQARTALRGVGGVGGEAPRHLGQGPPFFLRETPGALLQAADDEGAVGLAATYQVAEAPLALELAGLLQGGAPIFHSGGRGHSRGLRLVWRSCNHSCSASCASRRRCRR